MYKILGKTGMKWKELYCTDSWVMALAAAKVYEQEYDKVKIKKRRKKSLTEVVLNLFL